MPELIVPPYKRDSDGKVLSITPQSAGWKYIGFEVYKLSQGETLAKANQRSRSVYCDFIWETSHFNQVRKMGACWSKDGCI